MIEIAKLAKDSDKNYPAVPKLSEGKKLRILVTGG
jgi:hypothetical protein